MIDCFTDNKNRTASFVRSTLTKRGGNLGTDGSVSYLFERKGIIALDKKYDEDKLMEDVLELNILDFVSNEDNYEITTSPDKFLEVKEKLNELGYNEFLVSEVTFIPNSYVSLDEETTNKCMSLIETLEDIEDVQNIYHNLEM